MSARVDLYLSSLTRFNASSMVLTSEANVCLRFPTGERFANQTTSHPDLVAMIEQIAPPGAIAEIRGGTRAAFSYESDGNYYSVTVEPRPGKWRVTVEPVEAPAAAPPASAPPSAPPAPAAPRASESPAARPVPAASADDASRHLRPVEKMLARMYERGASDLHLSTGNVPKVRLHGEIQDLSPEHGLLDAEAMMALLAPIIPAKNRAEYDERNDTDFAHAIPGISRFRANLFRDRNGPGAVFRAIPFQILTPEQIGIPKGVLELCYLSKGLVVVTGPTGSGKSTTLATLMDFVNRNGPGAVFRAIPFQILTPEQIGIPKGVLELCYLSKGLVVVTGPTGSGKSTTLATLMDFVNRNRKDHIITIEDPIEFVHDNKGCLVNQREVHSHTRSFKDALRAALREDPDIVLVGEMRDLETIAIAVETAETGHLVFGTLHTTTAPSTVDRIIDQFPSDRQEQIRQMLSESLRGVIAQTLCKKIGGGRVAAYEILIGSSAVSNLIRERKTFQLFSLMQTGRAQGMVTLNDSLLDLVKRKVVDPREAYVKSVNKAEFKNLLQREGVQLELPT